MATTSMYSQASDFNPRLRLDLSSGQGSLRSLKESVGKLPAMTLPPVLSYEDGFASMPPAVDYEKTISLMRGRHTADMHDRHVTALKRVAAVNARGFFLADVAAAREMLRLASLRLATPAVAAEYEPAVCDLLASLAVPFQKSRSNDDLRFEAEVHALVTLAAELSLTASPAVSAGCLEMVLALAVPPPPPTSTAEAIAREAMTAGPRIENLKVLRMVIKAGAVPSLVKAVARSVGDEAGAMGSSSRGGSHLGPPPVWERAALAGMRLLRALSRQTDGASAILTAKDELPTVLSRLSLPLGQPMLSMGVETCWNLLEAAPTAAAAALCTRETIALIVDLHERSLAPGACDVDRELRNEVVVLATLLAKSCDADGRNALVRNGLYHAALDLVCRDSARLVKPDDLNLELLTLALQFLLVMSKDVDSLPEAAPYADDAAGLTEALLECLLPADEYSPPPGAAVPIAAPMWAPAQRLELQRRAIKLLTNLAVAHPQKLGAMQPDAIAAVLAHALSVGAPAELRDAAIHLLVAALPSAPSLQAAAGEAGVLAKLVELIAEISYCGGPQSMAPFSTSIVPTTSALRIPTGLDAHALQAAVLALSLLVADSPENMAKFGEAGGVACVLPLVRARTDPALLHAAIECVWSAVVPSEANIAKFVQREGVLQLLGVLEGAAFGPRAHVLSCLSDLLAASPAAAEQATEWHGSARQSAAQLCLTLWGEESARQGSAVGSGKLLSSKRPLSTNSQQLYQDLNASLVIADPSDEAVDIADGGAVPGSGALGLSTKTGLAISGRLAGITSTLGVTTSAQSAALAKVDVRAKLYSVLRTLEFESSTPLSPGEGLLLTAAKKYVPLATSEAWRDIDEDGEVDLLPADAAKLSARLAADEEATTMVMAAQDGQLAEIDASAAADEADDLKRVRVLRDGPMYGVPKQKRGTSLFRARIEAKAKIAGMVAASKVGYRGPTPQAAEYADATVQAATEAMIEAGADPAVYGFTLRHVPQALTTLASAAGIDAAHINPFLAAAGVGLTATGQKVEETTHMRVTPRAGGALLNVKALDKERTRRVTPSELRRLCIDFQEAVAAQ